MKNTNMADGFVSSPPRVTRDQWWIAGLLLAAGSTPAWAQSCPVPGGSGYYPSGGGESLTFQVVNDATGETVRNGDVVEPGASFTLNAVATAYGECYLCWNGGLLATYDRTVI